MEEIIGKQIQTIVNKVSLIYSDYIVIQYMEAIALLMFATAAIIYASKKQ